MTKYSLKKLSDNVYNIINESSDETLIHGILHLSQARRILDMAQALETIENVTRGRSELNLSQVLEIRKAVLFSKP